MYKNIVVVDSCVAIKWENQTESYINLNKLRKACPCAWCGGESDVFGNTYGGQKKVFKPTSFEVVRFEKVGLYGVRFFWKDGHRDGIYTFAYLKSLS